MSKSFFKIFGAVFSVVGAVIGAGFIMGGEIAVFFLRDFSLSGVYSAFIFFAAMIFTVGDDYSPLFYNLLCRYRRFRLYVFRRGRTLRSNIRSVGKT